jgi:putative tryptophan/tyrosine transport system substrate-binding protein
MGIRIVRTSALLVVGTFALSGLTYGQQARKVQHIGMISVLPLSTWRELPTSKAFLAGLHDLGYDEGRNFTLDYRSSEGDFNRLPEVAAEVVGLKVDVIVQNVCGSSLNAARQATKTIPIVVASCNDDMVETGIIASLAHPGGNVTGLNKMTPELTAKRLDLLKEMVPMAANVPVLWDPGYSEYVADWRELRARAQVKGVTLQAVEIRTPADLDRAFAAFDRNRPDAVLTLSDTVMYVFSSRVAALATEGRLPIITPFRETTNAGGLMSYGPNIPGMFRRAAVYVDKILKGASPADLPVEQPTKFEFVINLKTAKTLGLDVPATLLARADEVIE